MNFSFNSEHDCIILCGYVSFELGKVIGSA